MATAAAATALGAAMIIYFILARRLAACGDATDGDVACEVVADKASGGRRRRAVVRRPARPPSTWMEVVGTLAETLRFTYSETLGKWPIADLAFGIKYLMRRQGNVYVAGVFAGPNCVELQGPEILSLLIGTRRFVDMCFLFSKRPFPLFLELTGFSQEDVLKTELKAGILKPAHTVLRERQTKTFIVLIRGTHSMKDTLTAVTGAVVPFHHSLLDEGGISKLVLGYAHCGMVAAARWIAKGITPCLAKAMNENPDYQIQIVGHSLGGGTAALLTYILREQKEFSSTTCIAFAPAACMTYELAESGKHFVTSIVNGTDLVPSFSAASIDDLRSEVTASSWLNDLRDQLQQTRFLNVVYRSASALGSRLQSFSGARERVVGAGAFLRPVSNRTQVVVRQAQNVAQAVVRSRSMLSSWSCMGARRRGVGLSAMKNPASVKADEPTVEVPNSVTVVEVTDEAAHEEPFNESNVSPHEDGEEEEEALLSEHEARRDQCEDEILEGVLWFQMEKDLDSNDEAAALVREEEAAAAKEIFVEENSVLESTEGRHSISSDTLEGQPFYPPGRILHMVALPPLDADPDASLASGDYTVGIYETPRDLYSKIRLSKNMINDHYMPMYKKMMDQLIEKFGKDDDACVESSDQEALL